MEEKTVIQCVAIKGEKVYFLVGNCLYEFDKYYNEVTFLSVLSTSNNNDGTGVFQIVPCGGCIVLLEWKKNGDLLLYCFYCKCEQWREFRLDNWLFPNRRVYVKSYDKKILLFSKFADNYVILDLVDMSNRQICGWWKENVKFEKIIGPQICMSGEKIYFGVQSDGIIPKSEIVQINSNNPADYYFFPNNIDGNNVVLNSYERHLWIHNICRSKTSILKYDLRNCHIDKEYEIPFDETAKVWETEEGFVILDNKKNYDDSAYRLYWLEKGNGSVSEIFGKPNTVYCMDSVSENGQVLLVTDGRICIFDVRIKRVFNVPIPGPLINYIRYVFSYDS